MLQQENDLQTVIGAPGEIAFGFRNPDIGKGLIKLSLTPILPEHPDHLENVGIVARQFGNEALRQH